MIDVQETAALWQGRLSRRLSADSPGLLDRFSVPEYIDHCQRRATSQSYRFVPDAVAQACASLLSDFGIDALADFHRLVLATLVGHMSRDNCPVSVPDSIWALTIDKATAILQDLDRRPSAFYVHENDLFAKDLAVAEQELLPCGSELVDVQSGLPRRTLLQGGLSQFLRGLSFTLFRMGGFAPLLESHWDRRLMDQFNEESFNAYYERIAELLQLNSGIRGLVSASWWIDPALLKISPSIGFLQSIPVQNGARLFRVGIDAAATRDATRFNIERNRLHKQGSYTPTVYMLVWERADLISWSEQRK